MDNRAEKSAARSSKKISTPVLTLLILILATGLLLRLDVILQKLHDFRFSGDAKNYLIMSQQLVENGIFGYAMGHRSGHPNAYVTPGYPVILSAAYAIVRDPYRQVTVIRFVQSAAGGVLTPLLAFLLAGRLFNRRSISLLTALFTAIYPTYILSTALILTEALSLSAMLLYFYLQTMALQKGSIRMNVLSGLAFAVNILIRPTMLPLLVLPFLFALFIGKKTERLRLLQSFTATFTGFLMLMLPWWIRNVITLHRLILLSTGSGDPLLAGSYPYMKGLFQDYLPVKVRVSEAAFARWRILKGFAQEPLLYLKWYTVGKIIALFEKPWLIGSPIGSSLSGELLEKLHFPLHRLFLAAGSAGLLAGFAGSAGSAGSARFTGNSSKLFLSIYSLAFLALLLLFLPENRYAYPLMFFLMLAAACIMSNIASYVTDGIFA